MHWNATTVTKFLRGIQVLKLMISCPYKTAGYNPHVSTSVVARM